MVSVNRHVVCLCFVLTQKKLSFKKCLTVFLFLNINHTVIFRYMNRSVGGRVETRMERYFLFRQNGFPSLFSLRSNFPCNCFFLVEITPYTSFPTNSSFTIKWKLHIIFSKLEWLVLNLTYKISQSLTVFINTVSRIRRLAHVFRIFTKRRGP